MCGIAGIVDTRGVALDALARMSEALEHRGPDATGYLVHRPSEGLSVAGTVRSLGGRSTPTVGLAHKRLSIMDITDASDQPMIDAGGRYALNYNGEVYNYVELRRELEQLGHVFRTDGDTEVVLAAYQEWGPDCVTRFVGMWALAVLDLERRRLFLSRDRFGIKPLFYATFDGAVHFASEIKALLAGGSVDAEPNDDAVRRFLLTGRADFSEGSFFRGVVQLPPAHSAVISLESPSGVRPTRYWTFPPQGGENPVTDAAEEFQELLHDAVRLHARADVPVGTCLSGGLDSSAIVCVADRLRERDEIPQYAHAGFGYVPQTAELSERPYMEEVVRRTSLRMSYVEAAPERVLDVIPVVARQQDEPFGTASIVVQWLVFEAARRAGMKVMLDGQGADEVFGGYHAYLPRVARTLLRRWRFVRYARFAAAHHDLLGRQPLGPRDAVATAVPALRRARGARLRTPPPAASVMTASMLGAWPDGNDDARQPHSINEILAQATLHQLPALLRFEDRNSMAHSVEARVPFLDHRLVEFAFRLPGDYKIRGAETKHVLREGLKGILPEAILARRDKVGFRPDPGITWRFAANHRESLLASETEFEARWFDQPALERLLCTSDRSEQAEFILWRVISTKLWLRNHWSSDEA
jgi:asparagine synthase (glutamine-hydrolysing)